jgi:hypothetical protein
MSGKFRLWFLEANTGRVSNGNGEKYVLFTKHWDDGIKVAGISIHNKLIQNLTQETLYG